MRGRRRAVALAIMRRGAASGTVRCRTRASPTIAKSSAIDQLNVAMDSIRFPTTIRQPRYAVRTRETTSGYQEILTDGATRMFARTLPDR